MQAYKYNTIVLSSLRKCDHNEFDNATIISFSYLNLLRDNLPGGPKIINT